MRARTTSPHLSLRPSRRALAALVAAGIAASGVGLVAGPALAAPPAVVRQAEGDTTTTTDPLRTTEPVDEADLPPLGPLPEIAVELDDVVLTSPTYDPLAERRDELATEREEALAEADRQADAIRSQTDREAELTEQIDASIRRAEHWEGEERRLDREVRAVAVDSYIRGAGAGTGGLFSMDAAAHDREATAQVTSSSVARRQVRELEDAQRRARRHRSDQALSEAIREGVRDAMAEARIARDEARADSERLALELLEAQEAVEAERREAMVEGTDFGLVVLDAYWKAARIADLLSPDCGIEWWALAGIGKIESSHGTFGGAEVRADGSLTKPIIGIPLTGSGGTAAIGDSDGGLIDGDPTIDRAAGPMQFIPQTWMRYGVDADQNDEIEIQNIYDAAASAALYLCAAAGTMTDVAGLQRGYFAYNHSLAYVSDVLTAAVQYGNEVMIDGVTPPPEAPPPPPEPETPEGDETTPTTLPPAAGTIPEDTAPPTTAPLPTTTTTGPIVTTPPAGG